MAILTVYDINSNPKWQAEHPAEMEEHEATLAEVEANANLIAAAPEMLEALKRLTAEIKGFGFHKNCAPLRCELEAAQGIITKATT